MLKITKPDENRVDIMLKGEVSTDVMRQGLNDLIAASQHVSNGQMLYTIEDFELPSIGAIGVEFSMMPQLFSMISRFRRCAVLCDTGWIRTVGEWEGKLIPGLDIKAFELSERDAAEDWLAAA